MVPLQAFAKGCRLLVQRAYSIFPHRYRAGTPAPFQQSITVVGHSNEMDFIIGRGLKNSALHYHMTGDWSSMLVGTIRTSISTDSRIAVRRQKCLAQNKQRGI